MTEVTNKLNIDPSLVTHLVQITTDKMKLDLQQVNSRMNVLEQKVGFYIKINKPIREDLYSLTTHYELTGVLFSLFYSHSHSLSIFAQKSIFKNINRIH